MDESRRIEDLHPVFQNMVTDLISKGLEAINGSGMTFFITDGFRSIKKQNELYAQGRNGDKRPIVTNAKGGESAHNFGLAVDCAFQKYNPKTKKFELSYDKSLYEKVYPVARKLGFILGADWKDFPDKPHFEYPNWKKVIKNPVPPQGGGQDMDVAILKKYGVSTVEELDKRIEEHVGTTWGAEDKPGGGHLGSARRDITQCKKDLEVQTSMAKDRLGWITELQTLLGLKTTDDIATIKAEVNSLLTKEDDLQKAKEQLSEIEAKHEKEKEELKKSLESKVEQLKEDYLKDLDEQLKQVKNEMEDKYGKRITDLEESLKQWEQAEQTTKLIHSIINIFKRRKV